MDIQENIRKKSEELIRKAEQLLKIAVHWEAPIVLKCAEINQMEDLNATTKVFENHTSRPGVYFFEITSHHKGDEIVAALFKYKKKKERACPKIDIKRDVNSKYLYCGSRKIDLKGRFVQHVGFGHAKTFSLHLVKWAKAMSLELKFHYAWLDENDKDFTELVESALAEKIIPLVGKIAV